MANAGFNDETTINANLTENSTLNASLGSVNQTNVNLPPINYIPGYKVAEEERRENEEERISNENAREEYINELKEEVASGAFDGKDGQDGRDGAIQYTAGTGIEITDENVINNTQTSAEWGNITGTLSDQSDLVTALSGKANTSDIPTKVSDLTNDSGFIDSTVNNLTNYYTKSQTYTKSEINSLISQIPGFNVVVVQTLPVSDIDPHTIYLVPKTGSGSDIYDEYIYINNTWELIGNTQADLSNYYTKTETDTLLGNKQNTLVSGTNIKTINNASVLGSGNISVNENEVQISDTEPTDSNNKLWIDTGEVGSQASEITNEYSTSTGLGYSANYINNLHTYSTDEQRIGAWIDGKPLYRKVVTATINHPASTTTVETYEINHNISNADKIFIDYGTTYSKGSSILNTFYNVSQGKFTYWSRARIDTNKIYFDLYYNSYSIDTENLIITILYTKTTD